MTTIQEGEPIQIIATTGNHSFELKHKALHALLQNVNVRHKKVCIVSVAGAFRKGKSFILGFLLRYLNKQGSADWLGPENQPLTGFSWKGGSERHTTGIWVWSKVFLCPGPKGEEVAVILMDTQGVHDSKSTVNECMTVFALSTMVSSVQVYNLSQNIQENDLHDLQFFLEYGRLAKGEGGCKDKPFQSLMFLIRDWQSPYEHKYGQGGGEKLLNKKLSDPADHQELRDVRSHIFRCFKKLSCFLMPYPGEEVATNPHFNGKLADISEKFKTHLKDVVPLLLSRKNLVVKEINGKQITCEELLGYFKAYFEIFNGDKLPQTMTVFQATAKANNSNAVEEAKALYTKGMNKVCGDGEPYYEYLEWKHNEMKTNAMHHFRSVKMGDGKLSQPHEKLLADRIKDEYTRYLKQNTTKWENRFFKGALIVTGTAVGGAAAIVGTVIAAPVIAVGATALEIGAACATTFAGTTAGAAAGVAHAAASTGIAYGITRLTN